jgi:sugar phosphate isomerase/epimerase
MIGVAATSYLPVWQTLDTYEFLEHCHGIGAAGIHAVINGDPARIRARAEQLGMYIEAMVPLPQHVDTAAFENSLRSARDAGAIALRAACCPTRRYEAFHNLADWQCFLAESHRSLETALPLLEKYKIPLGLENHKDWTLDEILPLFERYGSEYLGSCLDFGNNISLLDDPIEFVEKLAPYVVSTHFKNMEVEPWDDGFLLSEVLLGDGLLPLQKLIDTVRKVRPRTRFSLEMITRDPLAVPCLTDAYWTTFPERSGRYLARTLKLVQSRQNSRPLPRISHLPEQEQRRLENANVVACLDYARKNLDL